MRQVATSPSITFDDPTGATLVLDSALTPISPGGPLLAETITWSTTTGVVDFRNLAPVTAGSQTVSASGGLLAIPGLGEIRVAGLASGANFTVTGDGFGGTELFLSNQTASVADANQFAAAVAFAQSLPAGAGASLNIQLSGIVALAGPYSGLSTLPAGDTVQVTGSGGFDVKAGASLALNAGSTFTGGLLLEANTTVELLGAGAAGTGPIYFAGPGATLVVDGSSLPESVNAMVVETTATKISRVPSSAARRGSTPRSTLA